MGPFELDRYPKSNRGQDGSFMGGVKAFNVKRWVCFGISESLGLCQSSIKAQAFVAHF